MCGIIAVLRGREYEEKLSSVRILPRFNSAVTLLQSGLEDHEDISQQITQAGELLTEMEKELRTVPGIGMLVFDRSAALAIQGEILRANEALQAIDRRLDHLSIDLSLIHI